MIQTTENRRRIRVPIAARSPMRRARACCDPGSLLDKIEMKMTLSTPSTISRNVRVNRATRPEDVRNASMVIISLLEPKLPGNDSRFAKAPQSRASFRPGDLDGRTCRLLLTLIKVAPLGHDALRR